MIYDINSMYPDKIKNNNDIYDHYDCYCGLHTCKLNITKSKSNTTTLICCIKGLSVHTIWKKKMVNKL